MPGSSGRFITVMTEAVSTSETSVSIYQTTRRNTTEDSHIHARRENLKTHLKAVDRKKV
jgi:hypothetical protein